MPAAAGECYAAWWHNPTHRLLANGITAAPYNPDNAPQTPGTLVGVVFYHQRLFQAHTGACTTAAGNHLLLFRSAAISQPS